MSLDTDDASDASATMGGFAHVDVPTAEIDRIEAVQAPLVAAVRRLVDVAIRTRAEGAELDAAVAGIVAATDRLAADAADGPAGVRFNSEGRSWNWGNAAVGVRNAVAPPLAIRFVDDTHVEGTADLGTAYEGPPGLVHGGVSALLLDHLMGETASRHHTQTTFTGTLTMRYEAPLPLGPVVLHGELTHQEGRKVHVTASISAADGPVSVSATGVFVIPRWAVDLWEQA